MARLIILILGVFILTSCQREIGKKSSISITAPGLSSRSLATMTSAWPTNGKLCFAASVSGPGIEGVGASTCSPETGILAGYVESGQTIEVFVPQGSERKIDLYLYVGSADTTIPCPAISSVFSSSTLLKTYKVGSVDGLTFDQDIETVTVNASYPGDANNLPTQLGMPSSCTATNTLASNARFGLSADTKKVTNGNHQLLGRVGSNASVTVATGTGYKLIKKR